VTLFTARRTNKYHQVNAKTADILNASISLSCEVASLSNTPSPFTIAILSAVIQKLADYFRIGKDRIWIISGRTSNKKLVGVDT
jgi:hypothetical protein